MEELKRLRKARGLSQAKLAALADLDPSTVSQIETGARRANTRTLERLAAALGAEVADLFPKAQAPLPLDEELIVSRAEIREWLHNHGHKSEEEFLEWARALGADTNDEEQVLESVERGIRDLRSKRDEILDALRTTEARKALFPVPPGLTKEEIKRWLLKPPGRWELVNEIRHEYVRRELALTNYSMQLFAEGKASGYLSYHEDPERHKALLEHRSKVLEESYAKAVA